MDSVLRRGIRAVLFDAVGTLIYPDPPVAEAYVRHGREFGSALTTEDVSFRFAAAFARQEQSDQCAGRVTSQLHERQRWREIVAEVFDDAVEPNELFESLWHHFALSTSWRLFDDVAPALRALSEQRLTIGVASNFDDRLISLCQSVPALDSCQHIFTSAQIGYAKPAPEFFESISRQLGLSPREMLLVGDDQTNDFAGATSAGWQSVLVDRHADQDEPNTISSLVQLAQSLC